MPPKTNETLLPAERREDTEALAQLIETLESILQVFPEDVTALESLSAAYQQAGQTDKAVDTAYRLASLLSQQGEWRQVHEISQHILELAPDHPSARLLLESAVDTLRLQGVDVDTIAARRESEAETRNRMLTTDLSGELELGWFLLQHNQITQEQYEAAVAGLTEKRTKRSPGACLSLLSELSMLPGVDCEKIIGFLAAETMTPYVEVTRFELRSEICGLLPLDDARRLGVLPFESLRREVMTALLNPVDANLRKMLEGYVGRKLHFFLTSPEEFQKAVESLAQQKK